MMRTVGGVVAPFRQPIQLRRDPVEAMTNGVKQALADRRKRNVTRRASQQSDLKTSRQADHDLAERRSSYPLQRSRARKLPSRTTATKDMRSLKLRLTIASGCRGSIAYLYA